MEIVTVRENDLSPYMLVSGQEKSRSKVLEPWQHKGG